MFSQSSSNLLKKQQAREGAVQYTGLDEEQEIKYHEIVDLLLAGGYFRARISGMSWCITSCNEDLDVDLFFQEESSIGQRIKLGENIIRALRRMKCPYKLESYQIQGGANTADYVNIFPIIQWLVKKVIETREETGDLMRLFSESQFNKNYQLPSDIEISKHKESATEFVMEVSERYKASRKYRRGGRRVPYLNRKSEEENVQSVLLEYGDFNLYSNTTSQKTEKDKPEISSQLERALGGKGGENKNKYLEEQENEKRKQNELKKELEDYVQPMRIDKDKLDDYLPQNISELENQYQYNEDQIGDISMNQQKYGLRLHEQQVNKLNHEISVQKSALLDHKKTFQESESLLKEVQSQYTQKSAYNQRIILEISKLDALETPENTKQLHMLRSLIALNENLRSQETKFKSNCKRQLQSLKEQIETIKGEVSEASTSGGEASVVNDTFNQLQAKLIKVKQLLAKRNRDISLIERKIDEVPERSELAQYQRQFVELYEQVASKFTETRQYYNTYNTLEDSKSYLAKEVSILNSINDSFKNAMSSKSSREQFLESLNNILKSVVQSLEKTEQKLNVEKESKVTLNEKYNSLVEKERLYFKATKEFLEECKRNELLLSKLEQ